MTAMAAVRMRRLGNSGLQVSPLCLGAMNFGNQQFGCDERASIAIIHAYLDAGHNFIDTANVYSGTQSEVIVGKAVQGRRDEVVIATKAAGPLGPGIYQGGTSRKHLLRAVDDSLQRLGTDYIDLYQLHRYDPETPIAETLSTLNDLVRQGKIRCIGLSNWTASAITEAAMLASMHGWEPPISLQPQYSIMMRDIELEIVPVCLKFGIGIIPWSPLGSGMLTGKYRPGEEPPADSRLGTPGPMTALWRERILRERNYRIVETVLDEANRLGITPIALSLAWNLGRAGVVAPIIGPKSVQQLNENLAALDVVLPPETVQRIDEASEPAIGYPHDFLRMMREMLERMRAAAGP
jgi:aryl-alcohol dehydrogenase-like predicted oxidoreductase